MKQKKIKWIILPFIALFFACTAAKRDNKNRVDSNPKDEKIVIYQVFTRLFGSDKENPVINGSLEQNSVGKFEDFTTIALDSIRAMGMTHIWYTGVIEHASIYSTDTVGGVQKNHQGVIKGRAGSPYAIKDYYDINSYLSTDPNRRMEEFEALVSRSHNSKLKVIIDFVPNHVARGYHSDVAPKGVKDLGEDDNTSLSFHRDNNFYYIVGKSLRPKFDTHYNGIEYHEYPAKVTGNDIFSAEPNQGDWYETVKLNYGVDYQNQKREDFNPIPNTWVKMRDILLFWAGKGVDGFRCDMAEMVPHQFWGWVVKEVKQQYPDILFIAEIYNPKAYKRYIDEGGFDYLYDKVGLYDTLKNVIRGASPTTAISKSRKNIEEVQSHMLNFLENHDEQRIAFHEFAGNSAAGIPMLAVSTLSDNIPMMIYFGQELGEVANEESGFSKADGRTTIFDFWSMPLYQKWRNGGKFDGGELSDEQRKLRSDYISILKLANSEELFINGDFLDLTEANPTSSSSVYSFMRYDNDRIVVVFANLSDNNIVTTYNLHKDMINKLNIDKKRALTIDKQLFGESVNSDKILLSDNYISIDLSPYQTLIFTLSK